MQMNTCKFCGYQTDGNVCTSLNQSFGCQLVLPISIFLILMLISCTTVSKIDCNYDVSVNNKYYNQQGFYTVELNFIPDEKDKKIILKEFGVKEFEVASNTKFLIYPGRKIRVKFVEKMLETKLKQKNCK